MSCDAYVNAAGAMVLTITNTGTGGLIRAMTRFEQVDSSLTRKHEGTGLGIPLTKGLVEQHGGTFILTSEPGKGTTATVIFPAERVIPGA